MHLTFIPNCIQPVLIRAAAAWYLTPAHWCESVNLTIPNPESSGISCSFLVTLHWKNGIGIVNYTGACNKSFSLTWESLMASWVSAILCIKNPSCCCSLAAGLVLSDLRTLSCSEGTQQLRDMGRRMRSLLWYHARMLSPPNNTRHVVLQCPNCRWGLHKRAAWLIIIH